MLNVEGFPTLQLLSSGLMTARYFGRSGEGLSLSSLSEVKA
jgi:hypothetical protein